MTQFKYIIFGSLLLTACAHAPVNPDEEQPAAESQVDPHAQPAASTAALPNIELSSDLLYQLLMSEIASQRGQAALAAKGSSELAKKTRDPRIAMRATQLSLQSGEMDKAVESAKVWRETDPESTAAVRTLSAVLLRSGRLEEARQEIVKLLQADEANAGHVFMQTFQMLSSNPDKKAALKLMSDLAQQYPNVAEAHWATAQLAMASGDEALAMSEARQARALRADWDMAASLEAHLLRKTDPQQGLEVLRAYLSKYPRAGEIRLQYARALLDQQQYKKARNEFQRLADDDPGNPEMAFAIALISLQMNDLPGAETQLKQSLSKGKKDQDTVQYYLGQLSEAKKNDAEALEYYRQVLGGEHQFAAQIRVAYLLNKRGQIAEAIQQLHQIKAIDNQQRVQLALIEAQILRGANQHAESYQVLQQTLDKMPGNPDLLYETAMAADLSGKHEVFEELMRKLLQINPDHAHALNALGYSYLERNERIPEAMEMVGKALQLAPNDPAIIDSMGWGYYRSGNLDESIKLLRRAYGINPDPEIAAHLGEVLWMRSSKEEARKIWQDSLKDNPGNTVLQAVIKKFIP